MGDAERVEKILRHELVRIGIEPDRLASGTIAVQPEDDRYYLVIADVGQDAPWKRFRIAVTDSDEELRAVIRQALGPGDLDTLRAIRLSERRHMGGPPGECWCGHGSKDFEMEGFADLDGAHSYENVGHSADCSQECGSFHFHTHCRECAADGGKRHCCV